MNDAIAEAKRKRIAETKSILKGKRALLSTHELRQLIRELKGDLEFSLARALLTRAKDKDPHDVWLTQQLALCTYKDEELPPTTRFAEALELLEGIGLRDPATKDAETLALGGAVYKRLWERRGQLEHLHEALAFYLAAYERNPRQDRGYGGVNAAYVLDLLAARARQVAARTGTPTIEADMLQQKAQALRESIKVAMPKAAEQDPALEEQYWYVVTLAEIHFSLGDYPEAGKWLAKAKGLKAKEWERESTFRQLVAIARLQGLNSPEEDTTTSQWHPAWQTLAELLGDDTELALSCYRGKVGLALSGGGFRASLFHLGVLARLAEMDVLRSIEVLSTVSGGSIVGAHYYLAVRHWLQTHPDRTISRDDYLKIVRQIQGQFLTGVQQNLRTRALAKFSNNLRMIFVKDYSRSHRMGELYEEVLFAQVADGHSQESPRLLPDLLIKPEGEPNKDRFKPRFCNGRRRAKVPILLLNATSLNTGHSWQFTARWMGESPGLIGSEVDANERYRRPYYEDMPSEPLRKYRLGYAVAASACVPGLLEPLIISDLYPERTVQLVDGGVHDNQGVAGLLDEGCTLILCSDATGQMGDQHQPSDSLLSVPLRANNILMKRVRDIQYQDLQGRLDSRALQGLFFVHLKKGLAVEPLSWIGSEDPLLPPKTTGNTTVYGVDKDLQRKLAAIRTDLDAFTEVEAYSLMLSGYLMTEYQFQELQRQHQKDKQPGTWGDFDSHAPRGDWPFLALEALIQQPPESPDSRRQDLGKQLGVASQRVFKLWRLIPGFRHWSLTALGTAILLLGALLWFYRDRPFLTITVDASILYLLTVGAVLLIPLFRWLMPERTMRGYLHNAVIALAGFVPAKIQLAFFDRLFIERGRLKRLLQLK